jgi:uncharacterized repeat protein (TIGR01451 family)
VAVSPDGKSAYITNGGDATVSQYNVDPSTGALSAKSPATVATGSSPFGVAVGPDADVSVRVSAPASAFVGDSLTYMVTVANGGPSNAWQTSFTDNLPYGTSFVSATPASGTCTTPKTGTKGGTVTCQLGRIPGGANVATQIVVQVVAMPQQGSINDIATATSVTPDPDRNDNVGTAQTTVTKRRTVTTLSCELTTVSPGQTDPCTVTVTDTSSEPLTPTGKVKLTSSDSTDSFSTNPCTLSGSGGVATCSTVWKASQTDVGYHRLGASYGGDRYHSGSSGKFRLTQTG